MNINTRTGIMTMTCATMLAVSAIAQEREAILELGPVPLYPADGQISDDLKDRFVFIDYAKGDIVVSYPDDQLPGRRKVLRFGRHDQVEPVITSTVVAQSDRNFAYRYTLQNGPSAKKALRDLAITVAGADTTLTAKHPVWSVTPARSEVARAGAIRPEVLLTFRGGPSTYLARGHATAGFEITSEFRPGLVIAFAQALVDAELNEAIARTLPPAVQEQLSLVMNPHWDTAQAMTIGPKFAPTDPKPIIAMDFHANLNKLAVLGPLKRDSPFVSAALSTLASYMSGPDSTSLQLWFLEKAAPGLESEIAAAMRISLQ